MMRSVGSRAAAMGNEEGELSGEVATLDMRITRSRMHNNEDLHMLYVLYVIIHDIILK